MLGTPYSEVLEWYNSLSAEELAEKQAKLRLLYGVGAEAEEEAEDIFDPQFYTQQQPDGADNNMQRGTL
jgi:hypothetical protein